MREPFEAIRITDSVYWVGAIDWNIREFHGYATQRGTTYNAFLIKADKVVLVDTVKPPFCNEMLSRIASVVRLDEIDYVVSNHAEMDHSGCLGEVVRLAQPKRILASKKGVQALEAHFSGLAGHLEGVESGSTLDLGGRSLSFLETRMLHWPDSMFTYLREEDVLFSQDAFGMHLSSSERFADLLPRDILLREAAKYYANILLPFSPQVTRLLEQVVEIGLAPQIVAPDHGPVYRENPTWLFERYAQWASQAPTMKAVVVFDTMWGSTGKMARAVEEGLRAGGANPVQLMPLASSHRSDVATEMLDAGALVVGSPTLNNQVFPTVADAMTYLVGLRPKNVVGAAFGSFGWSGEAVTRLEDYLDRMKVEIVAESVRHKYVPDVAALEQCRELGKTVAATLVARVAACGC
jgi:flavorubredoxin